MTMMGTEAKLLDAISTKVCAGLPHSPSQDGTDNDNSIEWTHVSTALQELYRTTKAEYSQIKEQYDEMETILQQEIRVETSKTNASAVEMRVDATIDEIQTVLPELERADTHFRDVVAILQPSLTLLDKLTTRAKYYQAAMDVETRSREAQERAIQATDQALETFQTFTAFVKTLPAEYPTIRREAMCRVAAISVNLKRFAVEKLIAALVEIDWPVELQDLSEKEEQLHRVARAFTYLVKLQLSHLDAGDGSDLAQKNAENEENSSFSSLDSSTASLWAMEYLLDALRRRFRFHFERPESATNRLAKPEWYLSHIREQTRSHGAFLSKVITEELHKFTNEIDCCDAQILLLRGLIMTAKRKLVNDMPILLTHNELLCHTIDEVLLFEQAIDDEFDYGSWANTNRKAYPRCIDVFTSNNEYLFAWTKIDVELAQHVMTTSIFEDQTKAWQTYYDTEDEDDGWALKDAQAMIPHAALQFCSLLDFMCQRFQPMESEEHSYLYVTHVHNVLIDDFHRQCQRRGKKVINTNALSTQGRTAWKECFHIVNAAYFMKTTLSAWEQSSVFIELTKKVVQSEQSRSQVLKVHLEYSKTVLKNAAKAASDAVLTSEEATAVRHAITGPGAMIGPTAAFSAAYSVGSKTVKSLFGRAESPRTLNSEREEPTKAEPASPKKREISTNNKSRKENTVENEELLFSRSIFERQIADFKQLMSNMLNDLAAAIVSVFKREVNNNSLRTTWMMNSKSQPELEVSPELRTSFTFLSQIFACAHTTLAAECLPQFWKAIAASLDDFFATIVLQSGVSWSNESHATNSSMKTGKTHQYVFDMNSLASIFTICAKNPKAYLGKVFDVCKILEMDSSKLVELRKAIDEEDAAMEQITTMLEACNIYSLKPAQVLTVCDQWLNLQVMTSSEMLK